MIIIIDVLYHESNSYSKWKLANTKPTYLTYNIRDLFLLLFLDYINDTFGAFNLE